MRASTIAVFQAGQVVECASSEAGREHGAHDTLMARKGEYYSLFTGRSQKEVLARAEAAEKGLAPEEPAAAAAAPPAVKADEAKAEEAAVPAELDDLRRTVSQKLKHMGAPASEPRSNAPPVSDLPCTVRREGGSPPCNWWAIPCNIRKY